MATDLAAELADAIVCAATRAAGNHSMWTVESARNVLAADLRKLLPACYFCSQPARTLEAGYAVCEPMFHAGQRERLEDVPPEQDNDPVATIMREGLTEVVYGCRYCSAAGLTLGRIIRHYREAHKHSVAAVVQIINEDRPAPVGLPNTPGWAKGLDPNPIDAYSCPDWTPDERHWHFLGGQTWEHAHEGGHEAHSAVSHDLSGAVLIDRNGDVVRLFRCSTCGVLAHDHQPIPCPGGQWVRWEPTTFEEARPEPPSAVSEALDAARVLLNWLKNVKAAEFAGPERQALARALAAVDAADDAERARRYALGEEHGAMGGSL